MKGLGGVGGVGGTGKMSDLWIFMVRERVIFVLRYSVARLRCAESAEQRCDDADDAGEPGLSFLFRLHS